jgi:hypothetical protein
MNDLPLATKAGGEAFAPDELATSNTIDHGMGDLEFMIFCDENPLPILCACGCKAVAEHNARVMRSEDGAVPCRRCAEAAGETS